MSSLLSTFLSLVSPRQRAYLIVDRDLKIVEASLEVGQFAECPDQVIAGNDLRLGFPELIGIEEIFIDILEERQDSFELKAVARYLDQSNPVYIDFYILKNSLDLSEKKTVQNDQLIILLENVTEQMLLEQSLVQATNETSLVLSNLAAAKAYIDKIISSMADALLVTTSSGIIKTVNRSAQELLGYTEAELVNQPFSLILHESYLLPVPSQSDVFVDKVSSHLEVICQTKGGEKLTIAFSCSTIETETEGLYNFIYIGRDITDSQRTQKRLAIQHATTHILSQSDTLEEAIPKILEAIAQLLEWDIGEFWTVDLSNNQLPFNSQFPPLNCKEGWINPLLNCSGVMASHQSSHLGISRELPQQIVTTHSCQWISDLHHMTDFPVDLELRSAFGFLIQDDSEILGVLVFYSCNKQKNDPNLLAVMAGIGSQLGQFIKRKQVEIALLESEERYRDLFENASDLIQSVTPEGQFLYVNRAWRETLGYSPEEINHLSVFDILDPAYKDDYLEVLDRIISGEKIEKYQTEFITKDNNIISVEGSINCKFVEGKPVATRAIFRDITERLLAESALRYEQQKSEKLLLNILPEPIAKQLKQEQTIIANDFAEVTVMFADIVGFTQLASSMKPIALVDFLNQIFSAFDQLCEYHQLEKIKTIGDAYMVVGGLPTPRRNHAEAIAKMALDMQLKITQFRDEAGNSFNIRIGINTGPVVAGVIGLKKFSYDLWGDTVNIASRMESQGLPGQIQVTPTTYNKLKEQFIFQERGIIDVKGKGSMTTYFLIGSQK